MPVNRLKLGPDSLRFVVNYAENEGITILCDEQATRARWAETEFRYDVDVLVEGMNAHELVAFGTHQGSWPATLVIAVDDDFTPGEMESVCPDPLDGGSLKLESALVVSDWATFTAGCSADGLVKGERVELEQGEYRVTIFRSFDAEGEVVKPPRESEDSAEDEADEEDEEDEGALYYVSMKRGGERETPAFEAVPGSDGWF